MAQNAAARMERMNGTRLIAGRLTGALLLHFALALIPLLGGPLTPGAPAVSAFAQDASDAASLRTQLSSIRLPPGFSISLVASGLNRPRELALSPSGNLAIGGLGKSVSLLTPEGASFALDNLDIPNGVAFRGGDLFVAETDRVLRYDGLDAALARTPFVAPTPVLITDRLPSRSHHGLRFIRVGPDGKLYIGIGAPCNVCEPTSPDGPGNGPNAGGDERFATIVRMDPDGRNAEIFARGVRNTVGFDWAPGTRDLWFTDNGRDLLGDNSPPDELNRAPRAGLHFGYPYCHGRAVSDPQFGALRACTEFVRPEFELPAHVAALGMSFYTGTRFPAEYRGRIFIAEHGSWNRSTPTGYRISMVDPSAPPSRDAQGAYQIFAQGWLQGSKAWGRPVSVINGPDGTLLVSDDFAGAVYRIRYDGAAPSAEIRPPAREAPVSRKVTKSRAGRDQGR